GPGLCGRFWRTASAFRGQSGRGATTWRSTSAGHGRPERSVGSEAAAGRHAAADGHAHSAAVGTNDATTRRRGRAAALGALTDSCAGAAVVPTVGAVWGGATGEVGPRVRTLLVGGDHPVGVD